MKCAPMRPVNFEAFPSIPYSGWPFGYEELDSYYRRAHNIIDLGPFRYEVDYVSGKTRVFGIVGHPIAQVRSPEMFTAEFRRRGVDAILVPLHVLPEHFYGVLPQLKRLQNLGGLVFTIPF